MNPLFDMVASYTVKRPWPVSNLSLPATHAAGSVVDLQPPQFSMESEERHYTKINAQKAFLEEHLPLDL
jgi:hypothetical protein